MKYTVIIITVVVLVGITTVIIFKGNDATKNVLVDPNCPFSGIDIKSVHGKISINDYMASSSKLKSEIQEDIKKLGLKGDFDSEIQSELSKLGNSNVEFEGEVVDDNFADFLQSQTKVMCGVWSTLGNDDIYKSPKSREKAELMLIEWVDKWLSINEDYLKKK